MSLKAVVKATGDITQTTYASTDCSGAALSEFSMAKTDYCGQVDGVNYPGCLAGSNFGDPGVYFSVPGYPATATRPPACVVGTAGGRANGNSGSPSQAAREKLSAGDDAGIGIAVLVVILVAAIGGAYVRQIRTAKHSDQDMLEMSLVEGGLSGEGEHGHDPYQY